MTLRRRRWRRKRRRVEKKDVEEKYEKKTVKRCEKRNYMKEKGLAIDVRRKVEVEENHCHCCRGRRK